MTSRYKNYKQRENLWLVYRVFIVLILTAVLFMFSIFQSSVVNANHPLGNPGDDPYATDPYNVSAGDVVRNCMCGTSANISVWLFSDTQIPGNGYTDKLPVKAVVLHHMEGNGSQVCGHPPGSNFTISEQGIEEYAFDRYLVGRGGAGWTQSIFPDFLDLRYREKPGGYCDWSGRTDWNLYYRWEDTTGAWHDTYLKTGVMTNYCRNSGHVCEIHLEESNGSGGWQAGDGTYTAGEILRVSTTTNYTISEILWGVHASGANPSIGKSWSWKLPFNEAWALKDAASPWDPVYYRVENRSDAQTVVAVVRDYCWYPVECSVTFTASTAPVCGNGTKEGTEECDDGNSINDDDCSNACKNAVCGDSIVQTIAPYNEQCDDGNTIDGDGCGSSCQIEEKTWWVSRGGSVYGYDRIVSGIPTSLSGSGTVLSPEEAIVPFDLTKNELYKGSELIMTHHSSSDNNDLDRESSGSPTALLMYNYDFKTRSTSMYDEYQDVITDNPNISGKFAMTGNSVYGKSSNLLGGNLVSLPATGAIVYTFDHNISLVRNTQPGSSESFVCDRNTIFMIDGNLTIDTDVESDGIENGCTFIVSGDITVDDGINHESNECVNRQSPPTCHTKYDLLDGVFIADGDINILPDTAATYASDGLKVSGTLYARGSISNGRSTVSTLGDLYPTLLVARSNKYFELASEYYTGVGGYKQEIGIK